MPLPGHEKVKTIIPYGSHKAVLTESGQVYHSHTLSCAPTLANTKKLLDNSDSIFALTSNGSIYAAKKYTVPSTLSNYAFSAQSAECMPYQMEASVKRPTQTKLQFKPLNFNHQIEACRYNTIINFVCTDEMILLDFGLYQITFSLSNNALPKIVVKPNQDFEHNINYSQSIEQMVAYLLNPSKADYKKQKIKQLLALLESKDYTPALALCSDLKNDALFTKGMLHINGAEPIIDKVMAITAEKLFLLKFIKGKFIEPEATQRFKQLITNVLAALQQDKNPIPLLQAWYNLFLQRQEFVINSHTGKQYGGFAAIDYKNLYQKLWQVIEPATKIEFQSRLSKYLEQHYDNILSHCEPGKIITTHNMADPDDYAVVLAGHTECHLCS